MREAERNPRGGRVRQCESDCPSLAYEMKGCSNEDFGSCRTHVLYQPDNCPEGNDPWYTRMFNLT